MKPFKMFFGLAIALVLFFFVAKIMFIAFVVAAAASIMYAVFSRLKHYFTNGSYDNSYVGTSPQDSQMSYSQHNGVEPLFQEKFIRRNPKITNVQYVDVI